MLRTIRLTIGAVFFACITLLLLDFSGTLHRWLGWMAKVQFLPALLALNVAVILGLVLLTLVFGRLYCSVICPLGVFQDGVARLGRWGKRNRYSYSPAKSVLRYVMLAIMLVAFVAGVGSVVALLAPYSSYGRMVQNLLQPLYLLANNGLAMLAERAESYAFYERDVWMRSLPTFVVAAVTLVVIVVLAWRGGRTYCNTICPVGTVLGFLSRAAWFKIYFDKDKCKNCSLCSKNCKASCIDYKTHSVDYSRCVACGNCLTKCKFGALHYGHPKGAPKATSDAEAPDAGKRSFLMGASLAATSVLWAQDKKKVDGGLAAIEEKVAPERQTRLTPPGSLSASNFAKHCTACQLCVAQCPNDVLRPSTDLKTFMQPTMSYERGYCRPECTNCSHVCPTGAIHSMIPPEKASLQIGHAVWIKKNCLPVTDHVACGNCARHCPTGAIEMVPAAASDSSLSEMVMIPVVNESRCIGCGACENLCPARPFPAIYVEGHEVHKII